MENRTRFRVENGELIFYIGSKNNGVTRAIIRDIDLYRSNFNQSLGVRVYFKDWEVGFCADLKNINLHGLPMVQVQYWTGGSKDIRFAEFKSRSWDGFLMSAVNAKLKYLEQKNEKAVQI